VPAPPAFTTEPEAGCISNRRYFGTAAWKCRLVMSLLFRLPHKIAEEERKKGVRR